MIFCYLFSLFSRFNQIFCFETRRLGNWVMFWYNLHGMCLLLSIMKLVTFSSPLQQDLFFFFCCFGSKTWNILDWSWVQAVQDRLLQVDLFNQTLPPPILSTKRVTFLNNMSCWHILFWLSYLFWHRTCSNVLKDCSTLVLDCFT